MADYAHTVNLREGSGSYVKYNVSAEGVAVGDILEIKGVICSYYGGINKIRFSSNIAVNRAHIKNCGVWASSYIKINSKKGQEKEFSIQIENKDPLFYDSYDDEEFRPLAFAGRGKLLFLSMDIVYSDGQPSYDNSLHPVTNLVYHINPQLLAFDIGRCNVSGNWDHQGNWIRCRKLKLSVNPKYPTADYENLTLHNVVFIPDDGSATEKLGWFGVPPAAFTEEGYSDPDNWSEDGLFITGIVEKTKSYSMEFDIADIYESVHIVAAKIPSAFARLHLSGAAKGGVGIGMFSSATDDKPMFEVAENHESHFYGPVYFHQDINTGKSVGYTAVTLHNSSSSTSTITGTIPEIKGASTYICTGALGWNGGGHPAYSVIPSIQGNVLSATLGADSYVTFGILGFPDGIIAGGGSGGFTGTLGVSQGGTGLTSLTTHGILVGNGTSAVQVIGGSSTGAVYKTSASSNPTIGTLPPAQGGTGATSLASHGLLVGNGTSAITVIGASSTGAVYKTSSTANPTIGTLPIAQGGTGATSASAALSNLGGAALSSTVTNVSVSGSTLYVYKGGSGSASSTYTLPSGGSGGSSSIPNASSTTRGAMYLYTGTGQNTDGTMTQKAITDALSSSGGSSSGCVMGFTTVTLENTSSSAKAVSGTFLTISGAKKYICTGALGWSASGRPGVNNGAPVISGNTLTVTLAANGTVMFGILGLG